MSSGAIDILLLGLLVGVSAIIFLLCLPWLVLSMDKLHLERMDRQSSREAPGLPRGAALTQRHHWDVRSIRHGNPDTWAGQLAVGQIKEGAP